MGLNVTKLRYDLLVAKSKNFSLPNRVPVSTIYLDESGARNSSGGFFVVGFVKVRNAPSLEREIRHLRQKHRFYGEIHFADIKADKVAFYFEVVEALAAADVRVGGSVYDSKTSFDGDRETWEQQALMAARLIQGNINRGELVNVFMDLVQTPQGFTVAETVKQEVNRKLGSRCIVEACDVDSQVMDFVQLADLVASSIAYERRRDRKPGNAKRQTPKARVASRLRRALELDSFEDVQEGKVNIMTVRQLK